MQASRAMTGVLGAVAALCLVAPGADAAPRNMRVKRTASIPFGGGGIGSFTPAAADAGRNAAFSANGLSATGFRFTPASGNRRGVTVAVRSRTMRGDASRTALATGSAVIPSAYNLGVSIGWKRFALSGDVARMDAGLLPLGREAVDLGLSYSGRQWSTRVQLGADRAIGARPLIGPEESYSVDLGGSVALTGNLEVTGGVRYKRQLDRVDPVIDDRRDSQAVYVGTAFRF